MTLSRIRPLLAKVGINGFLLGLFLAIFLGWVFPTFGSTDSGFPWKIIINLGIGLVFFFYGVKLNPAQLRVGLKNWKLHLLIQLTTFLLFPALVWVFLEFSPWIPDDFRLGISYLSVLPSTVSASVVMVSIARGNIPAAIFNASISSLIGVVITPAWMGILGEASGIPIDFTSTLIELTFKVILPVLAGLALHGVIFPRIAKQISKLKYLDQSVIMIIVYTSFAQSFAQEVFTPYRLSTLILISISMLGLFFLVWLLVSLLSKILGFQLEDRITALFCGSKKSLVQGVVIGKVIFPDPAILGLVLLPVMLYHIQQLIAGSVIASWFERKK